MPADKTTIKKQVSSTASKSSNYSDDDEYGEYGTMERVKKLGRKLAKEKAKEEEETAEASKDGWELQSAAAVDEAEALRLFYRDAERKLTGWQKFCKKVGKAGQECTDWLKEKELLGGKTRKGKKRKERKKTKRRKSHFKKRKTKKRVKRKRRTRKRK